MKANMGYGRENMDVFTQILNAEFVQAARQGDYARVKALLDDGADVNSADDSHGSCLAKAASRVRHGIRAVSPESEGFGRDSQDGDFPLKVGHSGYGTNEPAQLFRYREPPGPNDPKYFQAEDIMLPDLSPTSRLTALQWSSLMGHTEITNLLLNCRANPRLAQDCRYQPIHLAARRGHHRVIFLLLSHNVDINSFATSGRTPLYLAAEARQLHTCQLLIDNGANVHARTVNGETAFFAACENGDTSLMRMLLNLGSKTHIRAGPSQQSIFHVAAAGRFSDEDQADHIEALKLLLLNGSEIDELDDGKSASQMAESKGFSQISQFLDQWRKENPPPKKKKKRNPPIEMKI